MVAAGLCILYFIAYYFGYAATLDGRLTISYHDFLMKPFTFTYPPYVKLFFLYFPWPVETYSYPRPVPELP